MISLHPKKIAEAKRRAKVAMVMREYKRGELHSGGDGKVVKNPKQAVAIAISESKKNRG